jgi:hypothetical protein
VERHGAEPRVPSKGWGGLLLLRLWLKQEAGRRVEARCGHEGLRTLLSNGHGAGVHSHVPLTRVAVGRPRCVGPAVGTSGGGGLARRATTASAVVAAAITAIVVSVIGLGPVATGVAVAAMGRARRWHGHRGSRRPGTVHVNLLQ